MSESQAVTKLFIVTTVEASGTAQILTRTHRGYDGDLFESSWRHKGKRYICYKREYDSEKVAVDLTLIKDDDPVPRGYSGIFLTDDTKEKALRKHILCFKTEPRRTTQSAITDIVLIQTGKREVAPAGYSTTNEVNDIQVAYRVCDIARLSQAPEQTTMQAMEVPVNAADQMRPVQNADAAGSVPKSPVSGLEGVPFEVNPKYDIGRLTHDPILSTLRILSLEEVNERFNYNFETEEKVSAAS